MTRTNQQDDKPLCEHDDWEIKGPELLGFATCLRCGAGINRRVRKTGVKGTCRMRLSEPLPCPFCGTEPKTYETPAYDQEMSWVGCDNDNCPAMPVVPQTH